MPQYRLRNRLSADIIVERLGNTGTTKNMIGSYFDEAKNLGYDYYVVDGLIVEYMKDYNKSSITSEEETKL